MIAAWSGSLSVAVIDTVPSARSASADTLAASWAGSPSKPMASAARSRHLAYRRPQRHDLRVGRRTRRRGPPPSRRAGRGWRRSCGRPPPGEVQDDERQGHDHQERRSASIAAGWSSDTRSGPFIYSAPSLVHRGGRAGRPAPLVRSASARPAASSMPRSASRISSSTPSNSRSAGTGQPAQPQDRGMQGRAGALLRIAKVLRQLLAGPGAREPDRDLAADDVARQPDHALGQIEDAHRLAHVEHEDLAAFGENRRLQHELDRLVDAHEEPGHPGIGDRDRAAAGDLEGEGRDHAAPAADDVAEAHRAPAGPGRGAEQRESVRRATSSGPARSPA